MEMLTLHDLHKTFNPGTVNEKVALNGVSLRMEAGDFPYRFFKKRFSPHISRCAALWFICA